LNLLNNRIENEGVRYLSEALKQNTVYERTFFNLNSFSPISTFLLDIDKTESFRDEYR